MRVRTIATIAILSAGCGTSGSAGPGGSSATASALASVGAAAEPRSPAATVATVTTISAPIIAGSAVAAVAPVELEGLADELRATARERVVATAARFRPLCDREGYPVVGNLITKESPDARRQRYDVSDHCAAVRAGR